jgi:hypothetical protein
MRGSKIVHRTSVEVPLTGGTFCVDINFRQKEDQDKPSLFLFSCPILSS